MSVETEGGPRSLRGVWAWLRRNQRAASLESVSSAGSARTAASFAFVPPPRRAAAPPAAAARRPRAPLLPLHIKYGLPLDTSTLPPPPRAARPAPPARRALSEYGRHAAHVPGKRRAPSPPTPFSATVPRRRAHKRPAPRPPSCVSESDENAPPFSRVNAPAELMDSSPKTRFTDKGDPPKPQGAKLRPEKNFLRHIFENKFRNSTVEPAPTRVLPSISELDREAAALIRGNRERSRRNNEAGGSSIYTQTDGALSNERAEISKFEEKEKLKEMLKELKDSLPKRPKHADDTKISSNEKKENNSAREKFFENRSTTLETPTLPIALKDTSTLNVAGSGPHTSTQSKEPRNVTYEPIRHTPRLVTHQIIVMDAMAKDNLNPETEKATLEYDKNMKSMDNKIREFHPMKVSALPLHIPKNSDDQKSCNLSSSNHLNSVLPTAHTKLNAASQTKTTNSKVLVPDIIKDTTLNNGNRTETKHESRHDKTEQNTSTGTTNDCSSFRASNVPIVENKTANFNVDVISQHSRRRDLVNQLEQSIAKGDERAAADAAVKLAQLRLSCSVLSFTSNVMEQPCTSKGVTVAEPRDKHSTKPDLGPLQTNQSQKVEQKSANSYKASCSKDNMKHLHHPVTPEPSVSSNNSNVQNKDKSVSVQIWVEDKAATRGPIRLTVPYGATLKDLRQQAEINLGLAVRLQRWIIGNSLCNDDNTTLISLAGPDYKAPFYLCLVKSELSNAVLGKSNTRPQSDVYTELIKLEQRALAPNLEVFECQVCMEQCAPGEGVVLRECVHSFCKTCLEGLIKHSVEPVVSCPATNCPGILQEREVRGLLSSNDYEQWLARGLAVAENGTRNTFHCRTPDCKGWAFCETGVITFPCPVCKKSNCLQCQAIHEGQSCREYRLKVELATKSTEGQDDEGTEALLSSLISRGEALECPECRAIIMKKWGCDWIKCSACKTEICWVTRGRRWGPAGRGDTSAGCRCGVDGRRCHPSCGYCH